MSESTSHATKALCALAAVVAALVVGTIALVSTAGAYRDSSPPQRGEVRILASAGALTARTRWMARFPLFVRGTSMARARPAISSVNPHLKQSTLKLFHERIGRDLGLVNNDVQAVSGPGGSELTIVPGAAGACAVASFATPVASTPNRTVDVTECDTTQVISETGLLIIGGGSGANYVAGLLPSSNSSLSVQGSNGTTLTVPLVSGVVFGNLGTGPPRGLQFLNASGQTVTQSFSQHIPFPPANGAQ